MAFEEYMSETYSSECACGKGVVQYIKRYMYNDWGHKHVYNTPIEIVCTHCNSRYHYEKEAFSEYLVPNGYTIPRDQPTYIGDFLLSIEEETVNRCSKEKLDVALADMTAPKRRYIKDLENGDAFWFANKIWNISGKKALAPIINRLREIIENYDAIYSQVEKKQIIKEKYLQEAEEFDKKYNDVISKSKKLSFGLPSTQYGEKHKEILSFWEHYKEVHTEEEVADLEIDLTFEKDFTGLSWDSYRVLKCSDPHFILKTDSWLPSKNKLIKKYVCKCALCGQEAEYNATDFCIKKKVFEQSYYPVACCSCHNVSSFEAKTMDILNHQGISFIREMSFESLVGDTGKPLRFDFALFKKRADGGSPAIDLIIELQGPHHYEKGYYDEDGDYITDELSLVEENTANRRFERQRRYDQKKQEYCIKNNIKLECIKYTNTDYSRLEKTIKKILRDNGYESVPENESDDF